MLRVLADRLRRWLHVGRVPVWYDPAYRLPLSALEGQSGIEPRRADYAAWFLTDRGYLRDDDLRSPRRVSYSDLDLVHDDDYLESLSSADTLARIFAVDPTDVPVDEVLHTVRLACGATVDAARAALARGGPTVNLLGGFHHAAPARGAGMCPVNDIAVAHAVVSEEGFRGRTVVLDLDAHPPDGTAECMAHLPAVWIGSLSGASWGPLPGVDETVLEPGTGDAAYLAALERLLGRMPRPALAFVMAGGDVLAGDRLGRLGLTLDGARRRDLRIADALAGVPTVWLPGGGYHRDAWKVLAGTVMAVARGTRAAVPPGYEPLRRRFSGIYRNLRQQDLGGGLDLSAADIEEALGLRPAGSGRLLGYYTPEGIEYALFRYGVLAHVQRLGYGSFRVTVERAPAGGERARVLGRAAGEEHVLIELVLEKLDVAGAPMLYVHWLTLRNPRARFSALRPQLPGQDVPGLGLAREMGEILLRMARRLRLRGVAFRPGYYHVAYAGRYLMRFVDAARQGRFEAMMRDLGSLPLLEVSTACAEGCVRMNGEPYAWEADVMASWVGETPLDEAVVAAERDRVRFTYHPPAARPTA